MKSIISFFKDYFAVKKTGHLKAMIKMAKDPIAITALKELNDASAQLEKLGKKKFGPNYKTNRYRLIDFFI